MNYHVLNSIHPGEEGQLHADLCLPVDAFEEEIAPGGLNSGHCVHPTVESEPGSLMVQRSAPSTQLPPQAAEIPGSFDQHSHDVSMIRRQVRDGLAMATNHGFQIS